MRRLVYLLLLLSFVLVSCENEDPTPVNNEQTLFMYLPWSTNLLPNFENNISDLESVIAQGILKNERVVVFLSTSGSKAELFELEYQKGKCVRTPLKEYTNPAFTTAQGITSILNDVKNFAPARRYAMAVGCHGLGWIPVSSQWTRGIREKLHWEYEGSLKTRFFGGLTSDYQTDITTLAEGITGAGLKMEYILFDDCYMSNIETAYDLKDVTHYLIGCPTEIMAYGMPYHKIGTYLIGDVDYEKVCETFLEFYQNYSLMPCGTISVTDCSELENMASIMKEMNEKYTFNPALTNSVQRMDGYSPILFFDLGDYAAKLCPDVNLLDRFNAQLERTIPYKKHTKTYYTGILNREIEINTYSGTMTSEPSTNSWAASITKTSWYKATH